MDSPHPDKSSRRDRRRPKRPKKDPRRRSGSATRKNPVEARPPVGASAEKLDTGRPSDEPLTDTEAALMQEHLRFLARHRKLLRLKVNAAEDLLINGARTPTDRGVCVHLLRKVDLGCVDRALARMTDPSARLRFVEGVARFSSDLRITILYLESLAESGGRTATAEALTIGLQDANFADVSLTQMRRLMDLVVRCVDENGRPPLLFGMLRNPTLARAFDSSVHELPDSLRSILAPLRVAHRFLFEGVDTGVDTAALQIAIPLLLVASNPVLRSYPEGPRRRLLDIGIAICGGQRGARRALDTLLRSFDKGSRAYSSAALAIAARMLATHDDDDARALLTDLCAHHRGFELPARWLAALDAPRVGRVALTPPAPPDGARPRGERGSPTPPGPHAPGGLCRGFWIDGQHEVWVRVASEGNTESIQHEALLRRDLAVGGVAPLLASGLAEDGRGYLATSRIGRLSSEVLPRRGLPVAQACGLAWEAVVILAGVASAGLRLPDAEMRRFAIDPSGRPWLIDLHGAARAPSDAAMEAHGVLAVELCRQILRRVAPHPVPWPLMSQLEAPTSLADLVRSLVQVGASRPGRTPTGRARAVR